MLYTVCNKQECERDLADREAKGERLFKAGMSGNSRGGAVWKTVEEAEAWLAKSKLNEDFPPLFAVYGVEADWDRDVVQFDEDFGRLVVTRPIARLP